MVGIDAGVVDQHLRCAQVGSDRRECGEDLAALPDIEAVSPRRSMRRIKGAGDRATAMSFVDVGHRDREPLVIEPLRDRTTETTARPRDQGGGPASLSHSKPRGRYGDVISRLHRWVHCGRTVVT